MFFGTPKSVLPGGERRSGFTVRLLFGSGVQKQYARESVFRSERMPESIDHHAAAAAWEERRKKMKHVNVRKLALAGILVAVGIVCSPLSIPVGASKCAPVQHFINILGGVFLGPAYAVEWRSSQAFCAIFWEQGLCLPFPDPCAALFCAGCCISMESICPGRMWESCSGRL